MNDKLDLGYETRTDVRLCVDIGFGEPQGHHTIINLLSSCT